MRAVLQRVTRAEVRVEGETVGGIGPGVLVLLGVLEGDDGAAADALAAKVARFRFFPEGERSMQRSLLDGLAAGEALGALVVPQFTLAADGRKGRRPSFDRALEPGAAERLYERFAAALEGLGAPVARGRFGARMEVELVNDGPVTFVLDEGGAPVARGR